MTKVARPSMIMVTGPQSFRSAMDGVARLAMTEITVSASVAHPVQIGQLGMKPAADVIDSPIASISSAAKPAAMRPRAGSFPALAPP